MACLAGIVFLALITRPLVSYAIANPVILGGLTFLAVGDVAVLFFVRRTIIARSERALIAVPEDPKALARWRSGYLSTYGVSGCIAMYGLMLAVLGLGLSQLAPLFSSGFGM